MLTLIYTETGSNGEEVSDPPLISPHNAAKMNNKVTCSLLILLLIATGIVWKVVDSRRNLLTNLPSYPQNGSYWLGISTDSNDPVPRTYQYDLWVVEFTENGAKQHFVTTLNNQVDLVDCRSHTDRLCVANREVKSRVFTIYEWDVTSGTQPISYTLEIPISIPVESWIDIVALMPTGVLIAQGSMGIDAIYFLEYQGSVTRLFESTGGCQYPAKLSPDGQMLAILCLGREWHSARKSPFDPIEQRIHLVKLDGSKEKTLFTPPTHYFNEYSIRNVASIEYVPDFAWSPDSKEIAFVASFSPPKKLTLPRLSIPDIINEYAVYGGVYSISTENENISKWVDTGSWYPLIAWSPDQDYLAYSLYGGVYVVSRQGKYCRIIDDLTLSSKSDMLFWSSDGAFLFAVGRNNLWILSMQDYSVQRLDIPPDEIYDALWVSTP